MISQFMTPLKNNIVYFKIIGNSNLMLIVLII